jgi:hypothetical protein
VRRWRPGILLKPHLDGSRDRSKALLANANAVFDLYVLDVARRGATGNNMLFFFSVRVHILMEMQSSLISMKKPVVIISNALVSKFLAVA